MLKHVFHSSFFTKPGPKLIQVLVEKKNFQIPKVTCLKESRWKGLKSDKDRNFLSTFSQHKKGLSSTCKRNHTQKLGTFLDLNHSSNSILNFINSVSVYIYWKSHYYPCTV